MDLDPRAPRLDTRALEHRAALRLLVLEARLQRELAGDGQDEDRVDHAVLADQLRGALKRGGADVLAEDRHERNLVLQLGEVRGTLGALDAVALARVEALAFAVVEVAAHADDHPGDADDASLAV